MSIVAFYGEKGGAGKTTCAISVAAEWRKRGSVLLVDATAESAIEAWRNLATAHSQETPTIIKLGQGLDQQDQLPQISTAFDKTVVDCPTNDREILGSVLRVADLVVIPVGTSLLDTHGLKDALTAIREACNARPSLSARVLINRAPEDCDAVQTARDAIATTGIAPLEQVIFDRADFAASLSRGRSVASESNDAAQELALLVDELDAAMSSLGESAPPTIQDEKTMIVRGRLRGADAVRSMLQDLDDHVHNDDPSHYQDVVRLIRKLVFSVLPPSEQGQDQGVYVTDEPSEETWSATCAHVRRLLQAFETPGKTAADLMSAAAIPGEDEWSEAVVNLVQQLRETTNQ